MGDMHLLNITIRRLLQTIALLAALVAMPLCAATIDPRLAQTLAARADVVRIEGNPRIFVPRPTPDEQLDIAKKALAAIEPGINATNAPAVWAQGFTGQGIVVGGQDSGVSWTHAALMNH